MMENKINGGKRSNLTIITTVVIPALMLLFNVAYSIGFTKSEIDKKPDMITVKAVVDTAITKHEAKDKSMYVRIDQVPGLQEQLNSILQSLDKLDKRFEKIEDRIVYGRK